MRDHAFTLIELIVALTIFVVIIVTVYSGFYVGLRAWRTSELIAKDKNVRLCFLKIEKELKNSFFFSRAAFKGLAKEMSFPLVKQGSGKGKLYLISYTVKKDPASGLVQIIRNERLYSDEDTMDLKEKTKVFSPLMKDIRFEYASKDINPPYQFVWQDSWDGDVQSRLPFGVKITFEMVGSGELYSKLVILPEEKMVLK